MNGSAQPADERHGNAQSVTDRFSGFSDKNPNGTFDVLQGSGIDHRNPEGHHKLQRCHRRPKTLRQGRS